MTAAVVAVVFFLGVIVVGTFLGIRTVRRGNRPPLSRCLACGKRHGTKRRPAHGTPSDNGASWVILCEDCWSKMPMQRRYEYYALQARRWGVEQDPEWVGIVAALDLGL